MLRLMMMGTLVVTIAAAGGCGGSLTPNGGTGGSPGTGGGANNGGRPTGGSTGFGGGAGSPDAAVCVLGSQSPQLWAHFVVPPSFSFAYDGPASVAQSTTDTLALTISVPADAGMIADAGDGTTSVQIGGMMPMPLLPVGARVWLTKSKDEQQDFGPPPPSSFAVRDGQGGPMLFGGAIGPYAPLSFPVQVDQLTVTCVEARDQECAPNSATSFAGAVVTGDQPVYVAPDELGSILLSGTPYEVRLFAASEPVTQPVTCTDFFGESLVELDVRASTLANLIAGLPIPGLDLR